MAASRVALWNYPLATVSCSDGRGSVKIVKKSWQSINKEIMSCYGGAYLRAIRSQVRSSADQLQILEEFESVENKIPSDNIVEGLIDEENEASRLNEVFGSECLNFITVAGRKVATLLVENGSKVTFVVEEARVTSYKTKMWHGGTEEFLMSEIVESSESKVTLEGGVSAFFPKTEDYFPWKVVEVQRSESKSVELILEPEKAPLNFKLRLSAVLADDGMALVLRATNMSERTQTFRVPTFNSRIAIGSGLAAKVIGLQGTKYVGDKEQKQGGFLFDAGVFGRKKEDSVAADTAESSPTSILQDSRFRGKQLKDEEAVMADLQLSERLYVDTPSSLSLLDRGLMRMIKLNHVGLTHVAVQLVEKQDPSKCSARFSAFPREFAVQLSAGETLTAGLVIRCADDSTPPDKD